MDNDPGRHGDPDDDPSDDPTRALDDFVRRMRPPAPDDALLDLSDLLARLAPERPLPASAPNRGGWPRGGETRSAGDVLDVTLRVDASWQPDAAVLAPAAAVADARLLRDWKPGAWIGAARRAMDAVTEFVTTPGGPAVETYPPQWLLALWPPQRPDQPLLGRWPAVVRLCALGADRAAELLLEAMPADAELWLTPQPPDWGLVAELLLHHDPALRPFQLKGLRAFVDAEREASFARINAGYHQAEPGGAVQCASHAARTAAEQQGASAIHRSRANPVSGSGG